MTVQRIGKELTTKRISDAIVRRVQNFPHRIAWEIARFRNPDVFDNLRSFRNCHAGDRCFILGNGPSLQKMNLDLLEGEYSFGLNRIYLMFDQYKFRPTYFVSINNLVLEQFAGEISNLSMPKFVNWNTRQYFPENESGLNFIKLSLSFEDKFSKSPLQPISSGGTVTYVAMQLAYWMGFKKVVLIGVDHNFVDKGTPNKTEIRSSLKDENHFHPDYFPKGVKWQLPDLIRSELAYRLAREAYQSDGREIVDATVGGKLSVFEKVDFEKVITR